MRTTTLCSLALAVFACNPDKGESDTEGAATDAATTAATDDPTGGATALCADHCAKLDECGDSLAEGCPEGCPRGVARYDYAGGACGALYGEYLTCRTAATCEALAGDPTLCEDKLDALISDTCTTERCDAYADKLITCGIAEAEWKVSRAYDCTIALSDARLKTSAACGDAAEATISCVTQSTCEQINGSQGCEAENTAQAMACE